ncbi:MAG: hypothetical protein E5X69_14355, partial [Mesorhizobium sp.]
MSRGELIALAKKWRWPIRLVVVVVGLLIARFLSADPNYADCIGHTANTDQQMAACTQVIEHDAADRRSVAFVTRGNGWESKADYGRAIADYDQA